ncbi:unnamed protein product [Callosobruchus maculatus]|uniref:Uncharacterized protein n=1 Tax=Callosobruchus maculatus TaxID=64391 RepID=A0A653BWV9_CALMS|nr:unnamed protein product [Callosobruchus maculatus]
MFSMKAIFVVFVANLIFFKNVECGLEEMRGRITALASSCIEQTGATPEMVSKAFDGVLPDDDTFKELLYCMAKEQHYIDDSGTIDESKLKAFMGELVGDEAMANSMVDKCLTQTGTPQDKAYNIVVCMYSQHH